MTETLKEACTPQGTQQWHWYNVLSDLVEQGGLEEDDIQWSFQNPNAFLYKEKPLFLTWAKDEYLLITMKEDDEDLASVVEALAKVVEYKPFCKYVEPSSSLPTYEWEKINPEKRYQDLQKEGKIDLERLPQ